MLNAINLYWFHNNASERNNSLYGDYNEPRINEVLANSNNSNQSWSFHLKMDCQIKEMHLWVWAKAISQWVLICFCGRIFLANFSQNSINLLKNLKKLKLYETNSYF